MLVRVLVIVVGCVGLFGVMVCGVFFGVFVVVLVRVVSRVLRVVLLFLL